VLEDDVGHSTLIKYQLNLDLVSVFYSTKILVLSNPDCTMFTIYSRLSRAGLSFFSIIVDVLI